MRLGCCEFSCEIYLKCVKKGPDPKCSPEMRPDSLNYSSTLCLFDELTFGCLGEQGSIVHKLGCMLFITGGY